MNRSITDAAARVLDRHPGVALPAEELRRILVRERVIPESWDEEELVRRIHDEEAGPRILTSAPDRLGGVVSRHWVLVPRGGGRHPSRTLSGRMRDSLRTLGATLEPGSHMALARWFRFVMEEDAVRQVLERG